MAYDGGPIDQGTNSGRSSIFGRDAMFGMANDGWTVATGSGKATSSASGGIPWVPLAVAGVVLIGFLAWNSRRK